MTADVRIMKVGEWKPFRDGQEQFVSCEVTLDKRIRDAEANLDIELADGRTLSAKLLRAVKGKMILDMGDDLWYTFEMQFHCDHEDEFSQLGITGVHAKLGN